MDVWLFLFLSCSCTQKRCFTGPYVRLFLSCSRTQKRCFTGPYVRLFLSCYWMQKRQRFTYLYPWMDCSWVVPVRSKDVSPVLPLGCSWVVHVRRKDVSLVLPLGCMFLSCSRKSDVSLFLTFRLLYSCSFLELFQKKDVSLFLTFILCSWVVHVLKMSEMQCIEYMYIVQDSENRTRSLSLACQWCTLMPEF